MTLVATSPNLVINYEVVRSGAAGFNFFDFTPFGLPILLVGILYTLFAQRWLPYESPFVGRTPAEGSGWPGPSSRWWVCAEGVRPWSPVDCARRS